MVGAEQVIVNGLGDAHNPALVARLGHEAADLGTGIHRVVAAIIEEIANIILLENLQNALIIGFIHIRIGNFIAAGAQFRGRGIKQQLQLLGILLTHVVQLIVQHAFDAVGHSINGSDIRAVQCGANNAVCAGVDDGGGTAGLANNASSL